MNDLLLENAEDLAVLREALVGMIPVDSEMEAIDRIRALEELKASCAAVQARAAMALDQHRRQADADRGIPKAKQGRGLGAEIGLARRESPHRGGRSLNLSRALVQDMPNTLTALSTGVLSEEKAQALCRETAWLPPETRRKVDALMADRLEQTGVRRLAAEARAHAQRLDQAAAVEHLERSSTERRVSVRPAPGNMAYLTALLPMPQAVAAYANLRKAAAVAVGTGDAGGRTDSQTMADLLVERVTGQASADAVPVDLNLVMPADSLFDEGTTPAWISGHGPLPAAAARRLIADTEAEVFLRRLFTAPESGQLVSMDSRRREFSGLLRKMVVIRDDTCRSPWCDAPIRHADHATPHREGGATSWENASGLCAACNYTKEAAGWRHQATAEHLEMTTPTGHFYSTTTSPLVVGSAAPSGESPPGADAPADSDPPPEADPP